MDTSDPDRQLKFQSIRVGNDSARAKVRNSGRYQLDRIIALQSVFGAIFACAMFDSLKRVVAGDSNARFEEEIHLANENWIPALRRNNKSSSLLTFTRRAASNLRENLQFNVSNEIEILNSAGTVCCLDSSRRH